jgi:hypothetical protein
VRQIASNPTREFLYETATMGEREMWAKLATIESNCGIEMELDACVKTLRERLDPRAEGAYSRGGALKRRGRVPSWNTVNFCGRDSYLRMAGSAGSMSGASFAGTRRDGSSAVSLTNAGQGGGGGGGCDASDRSPPRIGVSGFESRTSSAGSLSEFVAVVAAEEEKQRETRDDGEYRFGGPSDRSDRSADRESGPGPPGPAFSETDVGVEKGALRRAASATPRERARGPIAARGSATEPTESTVSPRRVASKRAGRPEDAWPAHQKMPTALMRIGSARLGASAELLPEVFGKNGGKGNAEIE